MTKENELMALLLSEKDAKISRLLELNARMAVEIIELRYRLAKSEAKR